MPEDRGESDVNSDRLNGRSQEIVPKSEDLAAVETSYRVELVRKGIHFLSLSIPVAYYFVSQATALTLLVPITLAFLVVDVARYYHRLTAGWFYRWFGWLLRSKELENKRLNGATNVLLSATICVLVFPKLITITAFSILIISDSVAALVGRRYGKHRFLFKTLQGSLAFFVSAVAVVLVTPKVEFLPGEYLIGMVGGAVGAVAEALSNHMDDNMAVPISVGAVMWLLYWIAYPTFDLSHVSMGM
jgi:dolichol kinase